MLYRWCVLLCAAAHVFAAGRPENILVVINENSALSKSIGEYYALRRAIPARNIVRIRAPESEVITRAEYNAGVAVPIARFLRNGHLQESILYIVTTGGVPLRIAGSGGDNNDGAAVDSELTLLYQDLSGRGHVLPGSIPNPFFGMRAREFRHPDFPVYLVTRLAGYDFPDVKAIIDRALQARNRGKFVIDLKSDDDEPGNSWLRTAALALPPDRVVFDQTTAVLKDQKDVIAYASWGSNDRNRHERDPHFTWLPGAIVIEFVSTDGRTFRRPPAGWNLGTWPDKATWFAGAPQSLTGDFIHYGATGASGHVDEPYLQFTPHPDLVLPAYYLGRNLAESFYLGIPGLSWQNIVIGDPLCSLGKP